MRFMPIKWMWNHELQKAKNPQKTLHPRAKPLPHTSQNPVRYLPPTRSNGFWSVPARFFDQLLGSLARFLMGFCSFLKSFHHYPHRFPPLTPAPQPLSIQNRLVLTKSHALYDLNHFRMIFANLTPNQRTIVLKTSPKNTLIRGVFFSKNTPYQASPFTNSWYPIDILIL